MREIVDKDIPKIQALLCQCLNVTSYTSIQRLGGMTNHTYKVELADGSTHVVRIPGQGTEALINRANEKVSTQLACALGIDAPMLHFGDKGEKVTRYIEGAQTQCASCFSSSSTMKQAAEILRTLHTCGTDTKIPFDVFDMAAEYEQIISSNSVTLFDDYEEVKTQVMKIRSYLTEIAPTTCVPCHNDPLCENWIMDKNGRLYLIDWEYAGMNDGMWDLADLSIEAGFSAAQDEMLLQYYLARCPEYSEAIRFFANKLYLDFLWSLWGKARVPFDGNELDDYASERYSRLKKNIVSFLDVFTIN